MENILINMTKEQLILLLKDKDVTISNKEELISKTEKKLT